MTGEEAYSLAICALEFLGEAKSNIPIQLFGTDISETAIEKARAGKYAEGIAADVSHERLRRFFLGVSEHQLLRRELDGRLKLRVGGAQEGPLLPPSP